MSKDDDRNCEIVDAHLDIRDVLHDFRGPLVNITGFSSELSSAVSSVTELLVAIDSALPDDAANSIRTLVKEDVEPCLRQIEISVAQLNQRLDTVTSALLKY